MQNSSNHPIDCGLVTTETFSLSWEKQNIGDRSFDLQAIPESRILSSGSVSQAQVGDTNYSRNLAPTSVTDYSILPIFRDGKTGSVDFISSNNPAIANNSNEKDNVMSHVSVGTTGITVGLLSGEKAGIGITTSESSGDTVDEFSSFASGSLIKSIDDKIAELKLGSTEEPEHYAAYSVYSISSGSFQRNEDFWLSDYDFSGVCVETAGSNTRMCAAITPWHALAINHFSFHPQVGETVKFCTQSNETISRTVDSFLRVGDLDCVVIKFTTALPETIKKYKMLPSDSGDYLPTNKNIYRSTDIFRRQRSRLFPIIVCSHYLSEPSYTLARNNRFFYLHRAETIVFEENDIFDLGYQFSPISLNARFIQHSSFSSDSGYSGYGTNIIGGDSGGPMFSIINNDLVLLASNVGTNYALNLCKHLTEIQSTINTLGPSGQTIQTVDISGFTDFSS